MQINITTALKPSTILKPLRAMIEIDGGELKIFPVADCDSDERRIIDALRFIHEEHQ